MSEGSSVHPQTWHPWGKSHHNHCRPCKSIQKLFQCRTSERTRRLHSAFPQLRMQTKTMMIPLHSFEKKCKHGQAVAYCYFVNRLSACVLACLLACLRLLLLVVMVQG
eukprot:6472922-Amphidinium_carterae.1